MVRFGVVASSSFALLLGLTQCSQSADFSSEAPGGAAGTGGQAGGGATTQPMAGKGGMAGSGGLPTAVSGSGGMSGAAGAPSDHGTTPATSGANFPFPQNRQSSRCSYPKTYMNADVRAAFEWWKAEIVTSEGAGGHLRVKRLPSDKGLDMGSTVSEGIGYGMLIAVFMNDQTLFDELWKYEQMWLSEHGLMDWYISADGSQRLGKGAASDADEDMAYALVMADRQWGGGGSLGDSYLNIAKNQIQKMWESEIADGKLLKPGDSWFLPDPWSLVNVSYFAPSYYRVFAAVSGNNGWNDVVSTSYDTLMASLNDQNKNTQNGLVPAWSTSKGAPTDKAFDGAPTNYQYDSCRTPFRIGIDYCLNGEQRAKDYVGKTSQFFSNIGVSGIVDGYALDGSPQAANSGGQSAAFIGPAAVGAMSEPGFTSLLDDGYTAVATRSLLVGGEYYDGSWTVLSLLMMTGNFLDYTQEQPLVKP
jgi:endo-1,4-beta-D-glucanase Y